MSIQEDIKANLDRVETSILAACGRAGRDRSEVTLVAVTKTRAAAEIEAAYHCGARHFGENRVEEAEAKLWEELPVLPLFYRQTIYAINNRFNIDEAELDSSRLPPFRYPEKVYVEGE